MALRRRQIKLYTETFDIYRPNAAKNSAGSKTYSLKYSGIACKVFTTPNFDQASKGITQLKEDNVFTDNRLHCDPTTDIQAEDYVKVHSPNVPATKQWFRVQGDPQTRQGVANRTMVYLMPGVLPPVIV